MKRIPLATYRLQFNREFTFKQAAEAASYLSELGVSDIYASPLFQAAPGSSHGYDVCSFGKLRYELGPESDFESLTQRLRELGLGLVLDIVPNHMGADLSNEWWLDVLEKGRASRYAGWFDIDWETPTPELRGRVLLPVLEDQYCQVLRAGKLKVAFGAGRFAIAYYERLFPLSPSSYSSILGSAREGCAPGSKAGDLLTALISLFPQPLATGAAADADFANARQRLETEYNRLPEVRQAVSEALRRLNGLPGQPESFAELHELLRAQHYRLAYWKVGPEEINYRRFFDVTGLVALRMELPEVFAATHERVLDWLGSGKVSGLRIDHPDGLWDPKQYFERLQQAAGTVFVVAEKILSSSELLPSDWPVNGTTGYDFLNRVNGLFVDHKNAGAMSAAYSEFTGRHEDFAAATRCGKREILERSLASDLTGLTRRLLQLAKETCSGQDLVFTQLRRALLELIAAFPVYRTYITEDATEPAARDREAIRLALQTAREAEPETDAAVFDLIEDLLMLRFPDDLGDFQRARARNWVMKFQQLTGPAAAKGVEDTAFYTYNRLVSLNEVGGDPATFGVSVDEFHAHNMLQTERWPHSMLATATHDTKRGEDLRTRLDTLSEMPAEWGAAIQRWSRLNSRKKVPVNGESAPQANDEYLLYQILLGAWPLEMDSAPDFGARVSDYMVKALREAKEVTSWTSPNRAYEEAMRHFVDALLEDPETSAFREDFGKLQRKVAFFGQLSSLAQTLLKLTAPGVPDIYQGTEFWDLNLVDPDNRRPVDFAARRRALRELKARATAEEPARFFGELLTETRDARVKLYVLWRTLQCRRERSDIYQGGGYEPVFAAGPKKEHLCAFARGAGDQRLFTVVPRLICGLMKGEQRAPIGAEVWQGTRILLPGLRSHARLRNVLTGELIGGQPDGIELPQVFSLLPVALLELL